MGVPGLGGGFLQGAPEVLHHRIAILHPQGHALHDDIFYNGGYHGVLTADGRQAARLRHALEYIRRTDAGQDKIQGSRKGILVDAAIQRGQIVLLRWRVALTDHAGAGAHGAPIQHAGSAEVQQHAVIGFAADHDIVGLYIPVNHAAAVQGFQSGSHGFQNPHGFLNGQLVFAGLHQLAQRLPLNVFHDDIHGIVGRKNVIHLHNTVDMTQIGSNLAFPEGALAAAAVVILAAGNGRKGVSAGFTRHQLAGIVLLDGDTALQVQVVADIGNAETAAAKDAPYQILPMQHSFAQHTGPVVAHVIVIAAKRADILPGYQLTHAMETKRRILVHAGSLLLVRL